jgi:hypothetical protein
VVVCTHLIQTPSPSRANNALWLFWAAPAMNSNLADWHLYTYLWASFRPYLAKSSATAMMAKKMPQHQIVYMSNEGLQESGTSDGHMESRFGAVFRSANQTAPSVPNYRSGAALWAPHCGSIVQYTVDS